MSSTYDLGTDVGKLRLLISDKDIANALFSDEELQFFIDEATGNLYYAGYAAFHALVRDRSLLAKRIKREGYESEQHAIKELCDIAHDLKEQGASINGVQTGTLSLSDDHLEYYRPTWRDINTREMR